MEDPKCNECARNINCFDCGVKHAQVNKSSLLAGYITVTKEQLTALFNFGYISGHSDTVEGGYTDVLPVDAETYHSDLVEEWLQDHEVI